MAHTDAPHAGPFPFLRGRFSGKLGRFRGRSREILYKTEVRHGWQAERRTA